jgi:hypothetical protein
VALATLKLRGVTAALGPGAATTGIEDILRALSQPGQEAALNGSRVRPTDEMVDATISRVRMRDPSRPRAANSRPGDGDPVTSTI